MLVGGGLGRTPIIGTVIREFLPARDLLAYLEAILRVYNRHGRRDNIYKARIKILVHASASRGCAGGRGRMWRCTARPSSTCRTWSWTASPAFRAAAFRELLATTPSRRRPPTGFARWARHNVKPHSPGYAIVTISLKKSGEMPGDSTASRWTRWPDLAERFGQDEIRVTMSRTWSCRM